MKTLGLIGGIGWESTARYYQLINETIRARCGSLYTAPLIVHSLQFQEIDSHARAGRWSEAAARIVAAAQSLELSGSAGLVLCSNLMHFIAPHIEGSVSIPLLHIGDALAAAAKGRSRSVGLLGTRFTVEHAFLLSRRPPHPRFGPLRIHTPLWADTINLDRIIYDELCRGLVRPESRVELTRMVAALRQDGAELVMLASSELALLLPPNPPDWLLDSTEVHALAAASWMLGEEIPCADFSRPAFSGEPGTGVTKRSQLTPIHPLR